MGLFCLFKMCSHFLLLLLDFGGFQPAALFICVWDHHAINWTDTITLVYISGRVMSYVLVEPGLDLSGENLDPASLWTRLVAKTLHKTGHSRDFSVTLSEDMAPSGICVNWFCSPSQWREPGQGLLSNKLLEVWERRHQNYLFDSPKQDR